MNDKKLSKRPTTSKGSSNSSSKKLSQTINQIVSAKKIMRKAGINNSTLNNTKGNIKSFSRRKASFRGSIQNQTSQNETTEENNNHNSQEQNAQKKSLKDLIDQATPDQRAVKLIDETVELMTNNKLSDDKESGREKYELIDKEEYEKLKETNEIYKKKKKDLHEEYDKLKETYEKISLELQTMNYEYYIVEKAKTDSITKIYSMENDLKQMIIYNNKLQNEITKEINEKNNVFRALNEFKRKYQTKFPDEMLELYSKIKDDSFNPMLNIDNHSKLDVLKKKINKMNKEIETKQKKIKELNDKIAEMNH